MRTRLFGFIAIFLYSTLTFAQTYVCQLNLAGIEAPPTKVDTTTHLEYIWLSRRHSDFRSSCGSPLTEPDKLTCQISKQDLSESVGATIAVGDKFLRLSLDNCVPEGKCIIECNAADR